MKKTVTSALLLFAFGISFAQTSTGGWHFVPPKIPAGLAGITRVYKPSYFPVEKIKFDTSLFSKEPSPQDAQNYLYKTTDERGISSTLIGNTYYDIQTNASVPRSIYVEGNGELSCVWNYSPDTMSLLPNRGTGYNYFDGLNWEPMPVTRIESSRNGWPNITHDQVGGEMVVTHNYDAGQLQFSSRPFYGSGPWTENDTTLAGPTPFGNWWPRMTESQKVLNNEHVCVLSLTLPTSLGGSIYKGIDGALLLNHSPTAGLSWDIVNSLLKDIDSTAYTKIQPDNYAIDAKGSTVAIAVGGMTNDLTVLKNGDDGTGSIWIKTRLIKFPIQNFVDQISDLNGDGIPDTIITNDGSVSVLVDNGGQVHVWAGMVKIINTDSTDGVITYFPTSNGIWYWDENMYPNPPKIITGALDLNGNGVLDIVNTGGTFNAGLATFPYGGTDHDDNIWVCYSAIVEGITDADGKNVRHEYLMGSTDNGATWLPPIDVMADDPTAEGVFGAVASKSNVGVVQMVYQKDYCAGLAFSDGNPDPCNDGKQSWIVYASIPENEALGINETPSSAASNIYPNPTSGIVNFALPVQSPERGTIRVYSLEGALMKSWTDQVISGNEKIDISDLPAGTYLMRILTDHKSVTEKISLIR